MRRLGFSATAVAAAAVLVWSANVHAVPDGQTTTSFEDVNTRVRSDGGGDYIHGAECIGSTRDLKTGATAFRTASHTVCPDSHWQPGVEPDRKAVIDFGDFVLPCDDTPIPTSGDADLDPCGSNIVPDVRIHTSNAFANQALSRGTNVEIYLSFNPALNNTDFYLAYEQPLQVTDDQGTRTVVAGPNAIAELYRAVRVKNKVQLISLGRYRMPMRITMVD